MRPSSATAQDDAVLVLRIRAGEIEAFAALYQKYHAALYRTALAVTGDSPAAEEILQECFLRAFRHIEKVDASTSLAPWLHKIALNLARNWLSRRGQSAAPLEMVVNRLACPAWLVPERISESKEVQAVVRDAILGLEFRQRAVVVLFYMWDFSVQEIAEILDVPAGTVKSRLYYGREQLRRLLRADNRLPAELVYSVP
ncbi:MAG: sigma-70 family RNA polymerase sigma factor [Chloroflexi bacterium]|nr:sigma-70 family RNA polymerase sigma factor [Chloroflexota bacterium]